ncbi:DEAD-box ATP-dependent RNA helicase 42-like [Vicia villosa]|uniref:DEAD-box ATP-dependent RNA helicase 42-like n=1 Tax=Vicia villosa TaxID=3911 RepID=UPI00273B958B|nr:DEAD-box ATP-dependent RNA helicase 42-like [Vicia villosa]
MRDVNGDAVPPKTATSSEKTESEAPSKRDSKKTREDSEVDTEANRKHRNSRRKSRDSSDSDGDKRSRKKRKSRKRYSSDSESDSDSEGRRKKRKSRKRYSDSESISDSGSGSDSESDESEASGSDLEYSDSESETGSEGERRERKRREKRRRREREEEKRRRREKEKRRRKKEREEERRKKEKRKQKQKKEKKERGKKGAVTNLWGKYGIIRETDMWNKRPEFTAWLAEVKLVNMEHLSNWEEKQMFKEFMEDHNTATFPSKKYYSLDAYYRRQMEKEMKKGIKMVKAKERTVFNDEEQRRQELLQAREKHKEEQVIALKREMESGMAQAMKEQAQLREEMAYQYKLGNFEAAAAIQRRLDPDAAV